MTDLLADLRSAFPVAESWIYFNHAAVSPLPSPVADAVSSFLDEARRNGSTGFADWIERREQARALAAELIGCLPSEIALTTNTSQGLLIAAEGLDLLPGDELLIVEDDFPANQIPWFRQRRRGAEVVVVPRRDGRVLVPDVLAAVTPATRLVSVSWVQHDTGHRLDPAALGAGLAALNATRERPVLFCLDAIQGLGAFPLDVRAAGIDMLAADSHKWMLGLEGAGLFYCREDLVEQLDAPFLSWWSLAEPFAPYRPDAPLATGARRWEFATMPTLAIYGMHAALQLLLRTGAERMAGRILELTDRLAAGLAERGWSAGSPRATPEECSGIVAAGHPSLPAEEVVDRLTAARVSVAHRGGLVRFSPHAWNTAEEVDRLLAALP